MPYESGSPMHQGSRSDLLAVKRSLDEGLSVAELWQNHFSCMTRNHRAFKEYKRSISIPRSGPVQVLLFVGPTNTHKSHMAHLLGNSGHFGSFFKVPMAKGSGLYFDGYDDHACVLFDEMDGPRCRPTFFNDITDRYGCTVPIHGGSVNFVARTIIICSNFVPKDWWNKKRPDISPFMRRISFVWFTGRKSAPKPVDGLAILMEAAGVSNSPNYVPASIYQGSSVDSDGIIWNNNNE